MAATLTRDGELTLFSFPIAKTETDGDGNVLVYGKASDGSIDSDEQIIDPDFAAKAIRDWLGDGANVRVQHNPQRDPAGVGIDMDTDEHGGTWVKSKIIEPVAQKLVLGGALRAYSVGIARPQITRDAGARGGRITGGQVVEISLVDRPANKNCGIQLVKAAKDGHAELSGELTGSQDYIEKMAGGGAISKATSGGSVTALAEPETVSFELPADVSVAFTPADLAKVLALKRKSPNVGEDKTPGGVDRDAMPDSDFAGRNRSFPIHSPGDVADAATSLGRAGDGNYDTETLKRNIKRIAHRKGQDYVDQLPDSWQDGDDATEKLAARAYLTTKYAWTPEQIDQLDDDALLHLVEVTKAAEADIEKSACTLCHGIGKIRDGHVTCPRCHGDGSMQDGDADDADSDDSVEKRKKPSPDEADEADDDGGSEDAGDGDSEDDDAEKTTTPAPVVKAKGKMMCKCGGMMKAKHKFCPSCGAPAGGVGEMPEKTGVKKSAVPDDTASSANDAKPIPPHREPDGAMMEAYEDDSHVPDDDGASERSQPTRLEEPMLKGDFAGLALGRIIAKGVPASLGILHDMTCPAFSSAAVAKCYPQRSLAAEVDEGYWQQKGLELAATLPYHQAARASQLGAAATILKSVPVQWLEDERDLMHKAFSDANPGPGTAPTPASVTPGKFNRPYLSAGHAAPSPAQGSPNSTPLLSGQVSADDFTRGALTDGHERPSPANSPGLSQAVDAAVTANGLLASAQAANGSSLASAIPGRPHVASLPASGHVSKSRTFYSHSSREQVRQAMQGIHDHVAATFPDLCPMHGEHEAPAQKQAAAPVEPFAGVPVSRSLAKASQADRKEAAFAEELLPREPEITKAMTAAEPDPMTAILAQQVAELQELVKSQSKVLKKQAKALDEIASQPDPNVSAYRGMALGASLLQKQASPAVPGGTMADVAERTKAMMMTELEAQFRSSPDPALREAAWRSILQLRGVG